MTPQALLNAINIIVWGWVVIYMANGAWAAITGHKVHLGDPKRLAFFTTALIFVGFNTRSLAVPGNESIRLALSSLSALDAILIWRIGVAYGRGELSRRA